MSFASITQSYRTGGISAFVSAVWEAFWLLGPPIAFDASTRRQFLLWGFVAFAVSTFQALYAVVQENNRLKELLAPKFDIVCLPDDDDDSRPYLQTIEVLLVPQHLRSPQKAIERRYRVGVVNLSRATIPKVRLVLE